MHHSQLYLFITLLIAGIALCPLVFKRGGTKQMRGQQQPPNTQGESSAKPEQRRTTP